MEEVEELYKKTFKTNEQTFYYLMRVKNSIDAFSLGSGDQFKNFRKWVSRIREKERLTEEHYNILINL